MAWKAVPRQYHAGNGGLIPPFPTEGSLGSLLLKPFSSARTAGGEEQIAIGVEKLDGRAVTVAVGVSEMYRGGDYAIVDKGAVLIKAVPPIRNE